MQLLLKPAPLNDCPWARRPHAGPGVVLAVPKPLPLGLAPWLRSQGWVLLSFAEDRGQAAALLAGGDEAALLSWLPQPPSHGSNTPGNLLPW
ncbi:MAG: hypothetical protein AAFZ49_00180 [Cyanobacteria bacterium J06659_2]